MSLIEFVRESNRIEGIHREPLDHEVMAHERLLAVAVPTIANMSEFVSIVQPDAMLRDKVGLNVRVGNHIAPPGGQGILEALLIILAAALEQHPHKVHHAYETLHPFTDGNGRSGRALWLWMMKDRGEERRALGLGFLHNWYYQTLEFGR